MMDELDVAIKETHKDANDYEQTVLALLAFANHTCWDESTRSILPDSFFSFGQRMKNQSGEIVTPDLVIQRSINYGMVTEARKDLPQEKKYWVGEFRQLESYDGNLKGWLTSSREIDLIDIVFLTHQTRGPSVARFLEEKINDETFSFTNKISVITFVVSEEVKSFINLHMLWGELRSEELRKGYEDVCAVPIELLSNHYGGVKFYDASPPLPYLLQVLWNHVFNRKKEDNKYDEDLKCTPFVVSVDELSQYVQEYFGPPRCWNGEGCPEIPKRDWIKKALDVLCYAKMAEKDTSDPNKYTIFFRKKRGDTLEVFTKICYKKSKKTKKIDKGKQLDLFRNKN